MQLSSPGFKVNGSLGCAVLQRNRMTTLVFFKNIQIYEITILF